MDTTSLPPVETSHALLIDQLQTLIVDLQEQVENEEHRKSQLRNNLTLTSKEQSILYIGLDISIVKLQREISRAKCMLSTRKMALMKDTFWRSL